MKILVSYRGIPQSPGWATGDLVVKAFRALGHEAYPHAKYYQEDRWVDVICEQDWDLIVYMECNDGDQQYFELKNKRARRLVCWLFDSSYQQDQYRNLVNHFAFEHIFLANPLSVSQYKEWGYPRVHYLPYAFDYELHNRPLDTPKVRDVAIVGSLRADRKALAYDLQKRGINVELIGNVYRNEYIDTLASSKIIINQNPPEGRGLLNMRHFEAQAAGSFLVEQWCDLKPNIDAGFHSYATLYHHDNIISLIDSCQMLLHSKHNQALQDCFIRDHTYQARCLQILKAVFPHEC